jgi:hypothetical protein
MTAQTHEKLYRENCPYCGSDRVKNKGLKQHAYRTTRQFKCSNCGKFFSVVIKEFPRPEQTCSKKTLTRMPFFDTANLLKAMNKPKQNVDSVFSVPCFCCSELSRDCNSENCAKLENYLTKEVSE